MQVAVTCLSSGPLETNAYLLLDAARGEGVLVDAPHWVWDQVETALDESGCQLKTLLLTHGHYDHTGDAARIRRLGIPIFGSESDRALFENPETMRSFVYPPDLPLEGFEVDRWIGDGEVIDLLGLRLEARAVPGHCPGNLAFYSPELMAVFVGDSLFAGSVGRTDLPGGSMDELVRAIREKLYALPDDTEVLPGHGPSTTVGEEKRTNPFVSG